jgi:hypothetical protein
MGVPPLLEKFLDQTQRNPKTLGNLRPGALVVIGGSQDSFP